jgi:hypothetical protein
VPRPSRCASCSSERWPRARTSTLNDHQLEVEFDYRAVNGGPFAGNPATNKNVDITASGIYTFDEYGKISTLELDYDLALMLKQLQE